jgi:hypothetical protein
LLKKKLKHQKHEWLLVLDCRDLYSLIGLS